MLLSLYWAPICFFFFYNIFFSLFFFINASISIKGSDSYEPSIKLSQKTDQILTCEEQCWGEVGEKGYRNRCKIERCQLLLCDTNSCTVLLLQNAHTCAHTMSKCIYSKVCVCVQARGRLCCPHLISYASSPKIALTLYVFLVSRSASHSVDDWRWLLRSKATGRAKPTVCTGSGRWALLEGGKGHHGWWGSPAELTSVPHIFLRITFLHLSQRRTCWTVSARGRWKTRPAAENLKQGRLKSLSIFTVFRKRVILN